MGFAAAVAVGQVEVFAKVADLEACRLHVVPRSHNVADVCCKVRDCGKIEHKLVNGYLAAQRHGN